MSERNETAERDLAPPPSDRAAPLFAFLAVAVVMVVGVLAYLAFEEGRPRRVAMAQNPPVATATVAPSSTPDPQPSPAPRPTPPS
ncbi:hypothetical protein ACO2Q3_00500 [Caulobacter sp. KR2-114]|uniref:hypothetical protein n=1 Tax=Caulobacter sp. KR2-114 TaxID=3400912 RepID=UPI003C0D147B